MPKMFISSRQGTFSVDARAEVAAELTDLGLRCENLPDIPKVRDNVWVQFREHPADTMFNGGRSATIPIMTLVVYALKGGLTATSKEEFIAGATRILGRSLPVENQIPAFIVIHEIPETDWGMFGRTVSLDAMRAAQ